MIAMKNVSILIDSFLESGYGFSQKTFVFLEKSRKPRRFFRLLAKIYGSEKSVASSLPFVAVFLEKNEKNDLEPEIQVNFSFVNLSILIAFCENIPCPEIMGREQTTMKGTTH